MIKKEDISETIERTQNMCNALYNNGLISYRTLHEDPSSYIIPNSEHQTKNVELCKPWTDVLIPNVVIPKRRPYPGSTKAAIRLAVGKGTQGVGNLLAYLKEKEKEMNGTGPGGVYKKTNMKEVCKDGVSRSVYIKGKSRYVKRRCPDGTYKYSPLRTK